MYSNEEDDYDYLVSREEEDGRVWSFGRRLPSLEFARLSAYYQENDSLAVAQHTTTSRDDDYASSTSRGVAGLWRNLRSRIRGGGRGGNFDEADESY